MSALTRPSRREFLETSARISGGLVVGFVLPEISRFIREYPKGRFAAQARTLQERAEWNAKGNTDLAAMNVFVDKLAVLEVIRQYSEAYDERSIEKFRRICPTISQAAISGLSEFFWTANNVKLTYSVVEGPQINGDEATIRFLQVLTVGGQTSEEGPVTVTVTVKLRRVVSSPNTPGGWVIDSIA